MIVTSIWKIHQSSHKGLPDRNFKTINKQAIKERVHTADQQYQFRKRYDARFNDQLKTLNYYLPDEEFTYGKTNRPPTPIRAVIEGFYGDVAE